MMAEHTLRSTYLSLQFHRWTPKKFLHHALELSYIIRKNHSAMPEKIKKNYGMICETTDMSLLML